MTIGELLGRQIPVVYELGHRLAGDGRARIWTRLGLAASAGVVVPQVLLLAGTLDFAVQAPLVSACVITALCWVAAISGAADRSRTLPGWLTRFGHLTGLGTCIALAAFLLGALVTWLAHVPWAWVAGGLPGFVIWSVFPGWVLRLALVLTRAERTGAPYVRPG